MKPLIPESQVENKRQQLPWKKRERDKVLNMYFKGATPNRIAIKIKRNPKAVERLIQEYRYNERNKAIRYEPRRRKSRKGLKMTKNEWLFVKSHRKRDIPPEVTARLLARAPGEVLVHELSKKFPVTETSNISAKVKNARLHPVNRSLDTLIAHIYLRRFAHCKILSDKEYAAARAEEREFGGEKARAAIDRYEACSHVCDIPPHLRDLAYYMQYTYMVETGKWDNVTSMPYDNMLHAEKNFPEAVEAHKRWSKKMKKGK